MPADAAKAAGLLFLVVVVQLSVMANVDILGGHPEPLARDRSSASRSCAAQSSARSPGSLPACWPTPACSARSASPRCSSRLPATGPGRYGETTGRDRAHAPLLSIAVITILYQVSALVLRYMLGEPAPAKPHLRRAPADRAPQSDPDRSGLRAHAPSAAAARVGDTGGAPPWLTAYPSRRFLPPDPRRRRALPAHAEAGAAGRPARHGRARRLRRRSSCDSGRCRS